MFADRGRGRDINSCTVFRANKQTIKYKQKLLNIQTKKQMNKYIHANNQAKKEEENS